MKEFLEELTKIYKEMDDKDSEEMNEIQIW